METQWAVRYLPPFLWHGNTATVRRNRNAPKRWHVVRKTEYTALEIERTGVLELAVNVVQMQNLFVTMQHCSQGQNVGGALYHIQRFSAAAAYFRSSCLTTWQTFRENEGWVVWFAETTLAIAMIATSLHTVRLWVGNASRHLKKNWFAVAEFVWKFFFSSSYFFQHRVAIWWDAFYIRLSFNRTKESSSEMLIGVQHAQVQAARL